MCFCFLWCNWLFQFCGIIDKNYRSIASVLAPWWFVWLHFPLQQWLNSQVTHESLTPNSQQSSISSSLIFNVPLQKLVDCCRYKMKLKNTEYFESRNIILSFKGNVNLFEKLISKIDTLSEFIWYPKKAVLFCAKWQFILCLVVVYAFLAVAVALAIFFWAGTIRSRHNSW